MKDFRKGFYSYTPYTVISFKVNGVNYIIVKNTSTYLPTEEACVEIEQQLTVSDHKEAKEVITCLMKKL
jgi:hypothetical protein